MSDSIPKGPPQGNQKAALDAKVAEAKLALPEALDIIAGNIKTFIWLEDWQADMAALWIAYTHVYDCWVNSPMLLLHSAVHGCAKSPLMLIISHMARNGKVYVTPTGPTIFRAIEASKETVGGIMTLGIDEADKCRWYDQGGLLATLNASWMKGAVVPRCGGDDYAVGEYEPFGPKFLAMKDKYPPSDLLDRMLTIEMHPKPGNISRKDYVEDYFGAMYELRDFLSKIADWLRPILRRMEPIMPREIVNRPRLKWKPLFALAELADDGTKDGWLVRCFYAAKRHEGYTKPTDPKLLAVSHVLEMFAEGTIKPGDVLTAKVIVDLMRERDDWPWADLTANTFGGWMKDLGQPSKPNTWDSKAKKQVRGFKASQFEAIARGHNIRGRAAPNPPAKIRATKTEQVDQDDKNTDGEDDRSSSQIL